MTVLLITSCKIVPLPTHDLSSTDYTALREGKLLTVKNRLENRGISNLNDAELSVLCDIYIKFVAIYESRTCLKDLEKRTKRLNNYEREKINGKKALITLMLNDTVSAKYLTKDATQYGTRYINALAQAREGNSQPANSLAKSWEFSSDPETKYLSAALFVATKEYHHALKVLLSPEPPRLSRDYSVTGGTNIIGGRFRPALLRLDLFDDFGFGFLELNSFAPPANVFVEYLIAKSMAETGKTIEARNRLQSLVNYRMIAAFRDIHWRSLHELGMITAKQGKTKDAINYFSEAIQVVERMRSSTSTHAGRIGFVGDKQDTYKKIINLLLKEGNKEEAFIFVERSRGRSLIDLLESQKKFGGRSNKYPNFNTDLSKSKEYESQIQSLSFDPHIDEKEDELNEGLRVAEDHRKYVYEKYYNKDMFPLAAPPKKLDVRNIQKQLMGDERLIEYFKKDENTWSCFILSRSNLVEITINAPELHQLVFYFRRAIKQYKTDKSSYLPISEKLYNILILPVLPHMNDVTKLTIVPFGPLHYLPFSALRSSKDFLIEEFSIRVLPSSSILSYYFIPNKDGMRSMIIGNPLTMNQRTLTYAQLEASEIKDLLPHSDLILGSRATSEFFLTQAKNYANLHIAAHGIFKPKNPLASSLLLAPSYEGDDGFVTVANLFEIENRLYSKLVVLSACETGLVGIAKGDEIIGFLVAFLSAGSDSIISSLWSVDDISTSKLMVYFYNLLSSKPAPDSLREAQIMMINNNKGKFSHPFFWAPFIFTGFAWH